MLSYGVLNVPFRIFRVGLLVFVSLILSTLAHSQTAFDEVLQEVEKDASFTRVIDPGYEQDEWSVDGLIIRGGSESALDRGTSEALYAMGFRFYTPRWFHYPDEVRPIQITKRKSQVPNINIWLSYGHDRSSDTGKKLAADFKRWQTLNDVGNRAWPAGHTWQRIINANKEIYERNPDLLRGPRTFELDDPEAYRANVEICASYLAGKLNAFGRHAFDPSDGDQYPSETIYRFSLDVVKEIRRTVPHAQLGLYAYAGHRLPVSFKLPGIYIQVALGFNKSEFSYQELIDRHAQVADAIMLREYFDVEAWFHSLPAGNRRNQRDYYSTDYPSYFASGVRVVNGEFNENWLANIVAINYAMRYMKDGTANFDMVLSEVVENVFEGDEAVRELYWLWSRPESSFDRKMARESFLIAAKLKPGWYATAFKQYLVVSLKVLELGSKRDPLNENYASKLADVLSNVQALEAEGWIHAYAFFRRLANGNVGRDFPDLWMMRKPPPDWQANPRLPDKAEFDAALARLVGNEPNQN